MSSEDCGEAPSVPSRIGLALLSSPINVSIDLATSGGTSSAAALSRFAVTNSRALRFTGGAGRSTWGRS